MIVFRVANRDRVVSRQAQYNEGVAEPGGFADRLREHPEATAIKQQHERQFEVANHGQDPGRKYCVGLHYTLACSEVDRTTTEFIQEERVRRGPNNLERPLEKANTAPFST